MTCGMHVVKMENMHLLAYCINCFKGNDQPKMIPLTLTIFISISTMENFL